MCPLSPHVMLKLDDHRAGKDVVLARAALAKYHSERLFLTVLEAGKSKVRMLACLVPGEDSLACRWQPS